MCVVVKSEIVVVIAVSTSSYNLAALSLERMSSVIWPLKHRIYFRRRHQKFIAVAIPAVGVFYVLACVGLAGADYPRSGIVTGFCWYLSETLFGVDVRAFRFANVLVLRIAPMVIMVVSNAVTYCYMLAMPKSRARKFDLAATLTATVLVYVMCHTLRISCILIGDNLKSSRVIYRVALLLMIGNSSVNPLSSRSCSPRTGWSYVIRRRSWWAWSVVGGVSSRMLMRFG